MKKSLLCFFFAVLCLLAPSAALAQTTGRVSGKVNDQYGNPVVGAAVLVGGTNKYSVTSASFSTNPPSCSKRPSLSVTDA